MTSAPSLEQGGGESRCRSVPRRWMVAGTCSPSPGISELSTVWPPLLAPILLFHTRTKNGPKTDSNGSCLPLRGILTFAELALATQASYPTNPPLTNGSGLVRRSYGL